MVTSCHSRRSGASWSSKYTGAIDIATLKTEQDRISTDINTAKGALDDLDTSHAEWQEILTLAATLASRCADTYRKADDPTRRLLNQAIIERVEIKDGRVANAVYREPFDDLFSMTKFEYETLVELRGLEPLTPTLPAGSAEYVKSSETVAVS